MILLIFLYLIPWGEPSKPLVAKAKEYLEYEKVYCSVSFCGLENTLPVNMK